MRKLILILLLMLLPIVVEAQEQPLRMINNSQTGRGDWIRGDDPTFENVTQTGFVLATDPAEGYALISDSEGIGTWQYIGVTYLTASSINTVYGTPTVDDVELTWYYDDTYYEVTEAGGANALTVDLTFTGVTDFNQLLIRVYYEGSTSHHILTQLRDWDGASWEEYGDFVGQEGFNILTFPVLDPEEHIGTGANEGKVWLRFYHPQNGVPSHVFQIDIAWLAKGGVVGGSSDLSGFAKYDFGYNDFDGNGDFVTAGDLTVGDLVVTGTMSGGSPLQIGSAVTISSDLTVGGVITGDGSGITGVTASAPAGTIRGLTIEYVSTSTIAVGAGYAHCKDTVFYLDAGIVDTITNFSNGGFTYQYIDYSESTAHAIVIIDKTTHPVWSEAYQGHYDGDDRAISALYCDGAATIEQQVITCDATGYRWHQYALWVDLASGLNPTGNWQTPDDDEGDGKLPAGAVLLNYVMFSSDANGAVQVFLATLEGAQYDGDVTHAPQRWQGANELLMVTSFIGVGPQRKFRIAAANDDDNGLLYLRVRGYTWQA